MSDEPSKGGWCVGGVLGFYEALHVATAFRVPFHFQGRLVNGPKKVFAPLGFHKDYIKLRSILNY